MISNGIKKIIVFLILEESKFILKKYKPKIVGITGTVGKTSTKDAVALVLSKFYSVRKSKKSFNSEIGIPLTIIGEENPSRSPIGWLKVLINGLSLVLLPTHYPEWLVLEVGTDRPGDIEELTRWLKPDIVVVTKLAKVPVHVEAFVEPEQIFKEKGFLVKALKRGGTLVLNADDEKVLEYKNTTDEKVVLFGNGNGSDLLCIDYKIVYENDFPQGVSFNVYEAGKESELYNVFVPGSLGNAQSYHILGALAVVKALGENLEVAIKAFRNIEPPPGRMRVLRGVKNSIIIDDTYNSSPVALEEALNTLKNLEIKRGRRRIAVLGDMLELGRFSLDEHKKAGVKAAKVAKILFCVGVRARYIAEGALDAKMKESEVFQFDESREAGKFLEGILKSGDVVLIKGSQGIRMERTVEEVMNEPELKEKLLVRQDEEWKKRDRLI